MAGTWHHFNFFQHVCYLHAKAPRERTKKGSNLQIDIPWANVESSFTLLFEAYSMLLVKSDSRTLQQTCPRIGKAYRLKEQFKEIFQEIDQGTEKNKALELLEAWITLAITSEIEPIINFPNTLQKHWQRIITYFDRRVSNTFVEQVNQKFKKLKG